MCRQLLESQAWADKSWDHNNKQDRAYCFARLASLLVAFQGGLCTLQLSIPVLQQLHSHESQSLEILITILTMMMPGNIYPTSMLCSQPHTMPAISALCSRLGDTPTLVMRTVAIVTYEGTSAKNVSLINQPLQACL